MLRIAVHKQWAEGGVQQPIGHPRHEKIPKQDDAKKRDAIKLKGMVWQGEPLKARRCRPEVPAYPLRRVGV